MFKIQLLSLDCTIHRPMSTTNLPTKQNYDELSHAYDFFNRRLFGGELPGCLFTLQRKSRSMGYFGFERFVSRDQAKSDEIALNPEYFATRPVGDVLSTLVHEHVHQWQRRFGNPPRRGYHDQEFAAKMEAIGLMPSNTGTPGGKTTGEKMSHYIMADGPFIHACKELLQTSFVIVWYDRFPVQMVREYEFAADTTVTVTQSPSASAAAPVSPLASGVQDEGKMAEAVSGLATPAPQGKAAAVVPLYSAPPIDGGLDVERPHSSGTGAMAAKKADGSNRTKYVCGCKINIWGKPGLRIRCEACNTRFAAAA
jgi:hypothetical protein